MLTQRLQYNPDGSADLIVSADEAGMLELLGLAEELNLRSTVRTEGPIHILSDPAGNGPHKVRGVQ
jgi:hypothetical protein